MKKKQAKSAKNTAPKESKLGLTPLGDRVLIREITDKVGLTDSGIYIPDTVSEDKGAKKGKVVATGEGKYEDGKLIPVRVRVGETVLYQWGDKISYKDEEYVLVRESEIIAVVK